MMRSDFCHIKSFEFNREDKFIEHIILKGMFISFLLKSLLLFGNKSSENRPKNLLDKIFYQTAASSFAIHLLLLVSCLGPFLLPAFARQYFSLPFLSSEQIYENLCHAFCSGYLHLGFCFFKINLYKDTVLGHK